MSTKVISLIFFYGLAHSLLANNGILGQGEHPGRLWFGGGGPGGFGDPLSSLTSLFNCRPFNRTFVQTGVPCMQPNMTALNCRNETCACTSISFPGMPEVPSPLPPIQMPFSMWNCSSSNSTAG